MIVECGDDEHVVMVGMTGKAGRIAAGYSAADFERRGHALAAIDMERNSQDSIWGDQNHPGRGIWGSRQRHQRQEFREHQV
jgi:hypothetical protein